MARMIPVFLLLMLLNSMEAASQVDLTRRTDSSTSKIPLRILPQNFYNKGLGFFCKKEVQLQKATRLPLFIRLGSKAYVDYLERKPNATGNK